MNVTTVQPPSTTITIEYVMGHIVVCETDDAGSEFYLWLIDWDDYDVSVMIGDGEHLQWLVPHMSTELRFWNWEATY